MGDDFQEVEGDVERELSSLEEDGAYEAQATAVKESSESDSKEAKSKNSTDSADAEDTGKSETTKKKKSSVARRTASGLVSNNGSTSDDLSNSRPTNLNKGRLFRKKGVTDGKKKSADGTDLANKGSKGKGNKGGPNSGKPMDLRDGDPKLKEKLDKKRKEDEKGKKGKKKEAEKEKKKEGKDATAGEGAKKGNGEDKKSDGAKKASKDDKKENGSDKAEKESSKEDEGSSESKENGAMGFDNSSNNSAGKDLGGGDLSNNKKKKKEKSSSNKKKTKSPKKKTKSAIKTSKGEKKSSKLKDIKKRNLNKDKRNKEVEALSKENSSVEKGTAKEKDNTEDTMRKGGKDDQEDVPPAIEIRLPAVKGAGTSGLPGSRNRQGETPKRRIIEIRNNGNVIKKDKKTAEKNQNRTKNRFASGKESFSAKKRPSLQRSREVVEGHFDDGSETMIVSQRGAKGVGTTGVIPNIIKENRMLTKKSSAPGRQGNEGRISENEEAKISPSVRYLNADSPGDLGDQAALPVEKASGLAGPEVSAAGPTSAGTNRNLVVKRKKKNKRGPKTIVITARGRSSSLSSPQKSRRSKEERDGGIISGEKKYSVLEKKRAPKIKEKANKALNTPPNLGDSSERMEQSSGIR